MILTAAVFDPLQGGVWQQAAFPQAENPNVLRALFEGEVSHSLWSFWI